MSDEASKVVKGIVLSILLLGILGGLIFGVMTLVEKSTKGHSSSGGSHSSPGAGGSSHGSGGGGIPPFCDLNVVPSDNSCPHGYNLRTYGSESSLCCSMDPSVWTPEADEGVKRVFHVLTDVFTNIVVFEGLKKALLIGLPKMGTFAVKFAGKFTEETAGKTIGNMASEAAADTTEAFEESVVDLTAGGSTLLSLSFEGILNIGLVLAAVFSLWDPSKYDEFVACRSFLPSRNQLVVKFEDTMHAHGYSPPFLFPVQMVYPKEFLSALSLVQMKVFVHYVATKATKDQQRVVFSYMFRTGKNGARVPGAGFAQQLIKKLGKKAMDEISPRRRDQLVLKSLVAHVGPGKVKLAPERFSKPHSYGITLTESAGNDWNADHKEEFGKQGCFVPMALHSKYWYTQQGAGSKSAEVVTGINGIDDVIDRGLGAIGYSNPTLRNVPVLERKSLDEPIVQMSPFGAFKHNVCLGTRSCSKPAKFLKFLCKSGADNIDLDKEGVTFDEDTLICSYPCKFCKRMGLESTEYEDPTSKPADTIYDCKMLPGQDVTELLLGKEVVRDSLRGIESVSEKLEKVIDKFCKSSSESCQTKCAKKSKFEKPFCEAGCITKDSFSKFACVLGGGSSSAPTSC